MTDNMQPENLLRYSARVGFTINIEVHDPEVIAEVLALVRTTVEKARSMGAASAVVSLTGTLEK